MKRRDSSTFVAKVRYLVLVVVRNEQQRFDHEVKIDIKIRSQKKFDENENSNHHLIFYV